ncbi:hypothetical protein [Mesobacillus thioparans]|uniref:hypothetical protein n=1 Tax=Mesobacillus thioparans TaxID=370439 RepID=UPI0039F13375
MTEHDPFTQMNRNIWDLHQRSMKLVNKSQQEKREFKEAVLTGINQVVENTINLNDMFVLMWANNEKQEEVHQLLVEIFGISKAQTEQEAESKYRQVMTKVNEFSGDIETLQKIRQYGDLAYKTVMSLIKGELS